MTDYTKTPKTMDRSAARLLRFLARADATMTEASAAGSVLMDAGDHGVTSVTQSMLADLKNAGFILLDGDRVSLSPVGRKVLDLSLSAQDLFGASRQDRETESRATDAGLETVVVNRAESPLALLWRRRAKGGASFLTPNEFRAGERLRLDYSRGNIMPRLGVNWGAAAGGGRKLGEVNGIGDLTDAALAARQRVEAALNAVGPELTGVLVDVCCFLKGLERVEAERQWPARSAKVVLKSALGALARHYQPQQERARTRPPILHWGADDYRPRIR